MRKLKKLLAFLSKVSSFMDDAFRNPYAPSREDYRSIWLSNKYERRYKVWKPTNKPTL